MKISSKILEGEVKAVPSKSYAHRALICAALAQGVSTIYFDKTSEDIEATISCLEELGASVKRYLNRVEIRGITLGEFPKINVRESGSTFRFLLPVSTVLYESIEFIGEGRLPDRPIAELIEVLKANGVEFDRDRLPFRTHGKFEAGKYELVGNVSSQYISGILMAASIMNEKSELKLTSSLESKNYVDMTLQVMKEFGAKVSFKNDVYKISPTGYKSREYRVEGDWSNAAFFLVAGALGGKISMSDLNAESLQGDRKILDILREFGAEVEMGNRVTIEPKFRKNIEVDLKDVPDLLPILAILATSADGGVSKFYNGERLRLKESDRLSSTAEMIRNLGGKVEERENELLVYGTNGLLGGEVDSYNDHRIAMASSIASIISSGEIYLSGASAVNKSYPKFYEDFKKLGGKYEL